MNRSRAYQVTLTGLTIVAFTACSTTANIKRADAPDNVARIERSNERELVVRGSNGQLYRLPQESVADIDHPGNVLMTVGATLIAVFAGTYFAMDRSQREQFVKAGTPVYVVPGVSLLLGGGYTYFRSTRAAQEFEGAPMPVQAARPPVPVVPRAASPRAVSAFEPAPLVSGPAAIAPPEIMPSAAANPSSVFVPGQTPRGAAAANPVAPDVPRPAAPEASLPTTSTAPTGASLTPPSGSPRDVPEASPPGQP
jgi:hypothetical protein